MEQRKDWLGMLSIFIGALLWSTLTIFVHQLAISPLLFCGLRTAIAGILLLPFLWQGKIHFNLYFWGFVCSYCLLNIFLVLSLRTTTTAIAVGMQFTAPLWIFLFHLFIGKPMAKSGYLPLISILLGVLIFMLAPSRGSTVLGNVLALLGGILFAILTVCSHRVDTKNAVGLTAYGSLFSAVIIFVILLLSGEDWEQLLYLPAEAWWGVFLVGALQTAGGFAFFNWGLRYTTSEKASVLATGELVFGVLWAALFFADYPDIYTCFGVCFILFGIFAELWITKKTKNYTEKNSSYEKHPL